MAKIGVGFIGTGRISDLHALEYRANDAAAIVALCDADAGLAEQRAAAWGLDGAAIYADYTELLADPAVDLVEILLPHHLHADAALAAFAAGKAVSLQKPMTHTLDQADALVAAARDAGVFFKVFENFVFYPPVVKAKQLVDAGAIGEVQTIRLKSHFSGTGGWPIPAGAIAWRQDPAQNGGGPMVFDDGHHKFAIAWHFFGQAEQVFAWIGSTTAANGDVFDGPSIITARFPGGRLASLEMVFSQHLHVETDHYAQDDQVEITGSRGVIWITRGHGRLSQRAPVILYRDGATREYHDIPAGWQWSFINGTKDTIAALRDNRPPVLTGRQGREVLAMTLAAQQAGRTGAPVTL